MIYDIFKNMETNKKLKTDTIKEIEAVTHRIIFWFTVLGVIFYVISRLLGVVSFGLILTGVTWEVFFVNYLFYVIIVFIILIIWACIQKQKAIIPIVTILFYVFLLYLYLKSLFLS